MLKLRDLRKQKNLSMKELGAILGLSESTISLYENGKREPDIDTLVNIAQFFEISVDELLDISVNPNSDQILNGEYRTTIRDVHSLAMLNFEEMCKDLEEKTLDRIHSILGSIRRIQNNPMIDLECKKYLFACVAEIIGRVEIYTDNLKSAKILHVPDSSFKEHNKRFINGEVEVLKSITETIGEAKKSSIVRGFVLPFYKTPVSAGIGSYLGDDTPVEWVSVPQNDLTRIADYILEVRGDSMQPTFFDGDKVLVKQSASIIEGEIGVFILNSESYIKKMGRGELISLNPDYKPIKLNEYDDVRCAGKVIDTVILE